MKIDWFTIIAQALNFFILVWLMKRYLYKPIINAIDAREKRIADQLATAAANQQGADKQAADLKNKLEQFDKSRADLMSKAVIEAKQRNEQLLSEGKKEADLVIQKKREAASAGEKQLRSGLGQRVREEAFLMAKSLLEQLANSDIESAMIDAFLKKIKLLPENEKVALNEMFSANGTVTVTTAFDVSAPRREKISQTLKTFFQPLEKPAAGSAHASSPPSAAPNGDSAASVVNQPKDLAAAIASFPTVYKLNAALINGIELTVGGKKIAWNIANSLDAFAMASG